MYAIVKTGGKQYRVAEGDYLTVEKLTGEPEESIVLDEVLCICTEENMQVGNPMLEGVTVNAQIVAHIKGKKVNGITFKPKKGIRRRYGHRQQLTTLKITGIQTV